MLDSIVIGGDEITNLLKSNPSKYCSNLVEVIAILKLLQDGKPIRKILDDTLFTK